MRPAACSSSPVTARARAVYVDYAHKPEALETVLATLRPFARGKLVVVFGCGGDRDRAKRPVMGEIATRLADLTLVTDDNPRSEEPAAIRAEIVRGIPADRKNWIEVTDGRHAAIEQGMAALERQGRPAADRRQGPRDRPDDQGRDASFRRCGSRARVRRGGDVSALWTSDEVARALAPAAITAPFAANGVTFDSRAVVKDDLFFALSGETTDGHGFVGEALKRGAAAAVVSRDVEAAGGTLIRVPDTLKALVDLGRAGRRRSKARIASVTGSVGKTSTKDALRAMLAAQAPTSASAASFNNHVGVPISLARLPREARYGVFEIGMNHPGEIEPLARQVEAHVGVVTNVGPVHIGHMGSEEAIADEKGCLFAGMAEGAVAVLNRDSPSLRSPGRTRSPLRRVAHRRLRSQRGAPRRGFFPAACRIRAAMLSP